MNNIILFYNSKDSAAIELCNLLLFDGLNSISFIATENRIKANYKSGIAVFCSTPPDIIDQKLPLGTVAVCEPSDKTALQILAKNRIPAITAGMSGLDTVTLSSVSDTCATVCILRPITDLNGKTIDPCEFTVKLNRALPCRTISIYCAVMLLIGKTPQSI